MGACTFLLVLLLPVLATGERYRVWVRTARNKHAGTDDHVRLTVQNTDGHFLHLGALDVRGRDDQKRNSVDYFTFDKNAPDWLIGTGLSCITLHMGGDDAWLVDYVSVHTGRFYEYFRNDNQVWMSTDRSEGISILTLCN